MPESRKLTGLLITLAALLVLVVVAIVAVGFFGIGETLFTSIGGYIMGLGTAHQGAQMMADRSPNSPDSRGNYPPVQPTDPASGSSGINLPTLH